MTNRVHLIAGGYPRGQSAAHDMDYARLTLLQFLAEQDVVTTVAGDFSDINEWLDGACLLITYVAGPFPNEAQNDAIRAWLTRGGRWFALHGTSGGKAARVEGQRGRTMVKMSHHETLGGFFLNHPPLRKFEVKVVGEHALTRGLPASFEVADELYLVEMQGENNVLLTTEIDKDPSPPGFGFIYDKDTSAQADGKTRVLGYTRDVGDGSVAYVSLGHCHSPLSNAQPFVDESVSAEGATPKLFRGSWETTEFQQLLRNGIAWGIRAA
jgi:type 1 glutamine amidotransferase